MSNVFGVLFDGIAYGALLFLISSGLSVTMGLMNFVNLAHGAFAMVGGYACMALMSRLGWPFLAALPAAFLFCAALGMVFERTLYRHLYQASPLEQVLFTIGLTMVAVASVTYLYGSSQQMTSLPPWLQGQVRLGAVSLSIYRVFLLGFVIATMLGLLLFVERTRFGAEVRAAVDNPVASAACGINVNRVFCFTFALGTGLAGLGGALGADLLGLTPNFAFKYLMNFLLVVVVGGMSSMKGPLIAAMLLGVIDTLGKYYVPQASAFTVYALMIVLLVLFPRGLARRSL